jgi:hypothetical protein
MAAVAHTVQLHGSTLVLYPKTMISVSEAVTFPNEVKSR